TFLRGPNLPLDRVTGAKVEALDLAGADVDVVRAVEVVPVLAPEEAIALGENLEDSLPPNDRVRLEQCLLDAEDQVLFAQARVVGNVELLGKLMQLGDRFLLQFGYVHGGYSVGPGALRPATLGSMGSGVRRT